MELTRSEMEIMNVFWDSDKPLSRAALLEKATNKSWKDSSVHILLNGLLTKHVIQEAGFVKRNKTYGRVFVASMSREAYFATLVFSYPRKPDALTLLKEIVARPEVDSACLEALEGIIADRKKELAKA